MGIQGTLIPGPASPRSTRYDSHAPALRNDSLDTSHGSGPLSSYCMGSIGHSLPAAPSPPPAALPASIYGEALAIPDLPDLPLDLTYIFGDLDIPSLEDLVQDIGADEAELIAVATNGINLHRAQTLPAPSTLAKPTTQLRRQAVRRSPIPARQESLPVGPASDSDGSTGRKRKNALKTQVATTFEKIPESILAPNGAMQQPEAAQPSPFALTATPFVWSSATASADATLSRPSKKVEIDFILDDEALLERVMNDGTPFTCLSRSPKARIADDSTTNDINELITLAPAMSLPNRHWTLSPAAAIHAVHASRPGDEDVLKLLLCGK